MLKSHKGKYRIRGKEGPSFWIPAYAISTVLCNQIANAMDNKVTHFERFLIFL